MRRERCLLCETVQYSEDDQLLILNSAADPFVREAAERFTLANSTARTSGHMTLAEDNVALANALQAAHRLSHVGFHDALAHVAVGTIDVAAMNLLYQPNNRWMHYGLQVALHALKEGGRLYVVGAKDRGILTMAKHIVELFGKVETLEISKGQRVLLAYKTTKAQEGLKAHEERMGPTNAGEGATGEAEPSPLPYTDRREPPVYGRVRPSGSPVASPPASVVPPPAPVASPPASVVPPPASASVTSPVLSVFADSRLDEGTRLLLDALEVRSTDEALDIGCGAGLIGLHIARMASKGTVTMVDVSLAAVAATQQAIVESKPNVKNVRVLPSDGAQAVLAQRFDLVVTNPPFHQGGIQTTAIAERFIHEAAQVLRPSGRFYLVANRFLKYEPALRSCFQKVEEVGGDKRYKVLRATQPIATTT